MAKKKSGGVNKSEAIRDYKKANPSHKPKQIAEALNSQGIDVSAQFVSTVLSNSKTKRSTKKRGRPPKSAKRKTAKRSPRASARATGRRSAAAAGGSEVSYENLMHVKQLVADMGGVDNAREALQAYESLVD